jgi:hypothetical protein
MDLSVSISEATAEAMYEEKQEMSKGYETKQQVVALIKGKNGSA